MFSRVWILALETLICSLLAPNAAIVDQHMHLVSQAVGSSEFEEPQITHLKYHQSHFSPMSNGSNFCVI